MVIAFGLVSASLTSICCQSITWTGHLLLIQCRTNLNEPTTGDLVIENKIKYIFLKYRWQIHLIFKISRTLIQNWSSDLNKAACPQMNT